MASLEQGAGALGATSVTSDVGLTKCLCKKASSRATSYHANKGTGQDWSRKVDWDTHLERVVNSKRHAYAAYSPTSLLHSTGA